MKRVAQLPSSLMPHREGVPAMTCGTWPGRAQSGPSPPTQKSQTSPQLRPLGCAAAKVAVKQSQVMMKIFNKKKSHKKKQEKQTKLKYSCSLGAQFSDKNKGSRENIFFPKYFQKKNIS